MALGPVWWKSAMNSPMPSAAASARSEAAIASSAMVGGATMTLARKRIVSSPSMLHCEDIEDAAPVSPP
eukprot:855658-Heterocapsa_arctica.AAC.1